MRRRLALAVIPGVALALLAGLFMWSKLRLVTGTPRTAYATPQAPSHPATTDASPAAPGR